MRAELGSPVHDQHYYGANQMVYAVFGTRRLGAHNLTALSFLYFFNRTYDCLLIMPHQLEGLKIAEQARIDNRKFSFSVLLAILIGLPVTIWAYMYVAYQGAIRVGWAERPSIALVTGLIIRCQLM